MAQYGRTGERRAASASDGGRTARLLSLIQSRAQPKRHPMLTPCVALLLPCSDPAPSFGQPNKTLRLAKQTAKVTNLAGLPYGQVWELDQRTQLLSRTDRKRGLGTALLDTTMETVKNNSQLYDTNRSQKLSQAEIEALKTPGSATSGAALVDLLISNSATFAGKTEFSQEKYIKKKKAKHCSELQVLPVSIARVMETFWEKDPRKMRGMRPDTMAMILSTANIKAGVNSLVVESCSGVVLGSLLYRQQGLGYVVHAFENNQKRTEGVKRFNFNNDIASALLHVPLDKVLTKQIPIHAETAAAASAPVSAAAATAAAASSDKKADAPMDTSSSSDSASAPSAAVAAAGAAAAAVPAGDMTAEEVLSQQVDVAILATRYDPFSLLQSVWPYLKVTGRFVLYDECIEPLAAAHAKLSTSAEFASVNLVLSECFFRNHQVLPNRTHPFVNMSASGGYILSGIKMKQGK